MLSVEAEHLQLVKAMVTAIAMRDASGVSDCLTEDVVLNVPGSTLVSGTFKGREDVMVALARFAMMGGASLKVRLHDILANDQHGIVMYHVKAERDGKDITYSHIDIYHFRDGKISEVTGCPYDLAAFDRLYG